MAVEIYDSAGPYKWRVGADRSGSVLLYDAAGNPILDKTTISGTARMLPVGGADHDTYRLLNVDRMGRAEIPGRRLLLADTVEGATLNAARWTSTATTMTVTQSATGILFNASAITTTTTGALLTSKLQLGRYPTAGLVTRIRVRSTLVANQVGEWGFGYSATLSGTTAQVENGAHWRQNADGTVVPVVIYNSTEQTGSDISSSLVNTNYYDYVVFLEDDRARFICSRTSDGAIISDQTIRISNSAPKMWAVTHTYSWLRCRNNTAPLSAGQLFVGEVEVYQLDQFHNESWGSQLTGNALGTAFNPLTGVQLAQFANSANPTSATLSNTAAGYTTLGGIYQFAAVATAATDFNLFDFTVPAPFRLRVTGIHISMWNTGAANAATPATTLMWGIGVNGASVNLSTGGFIRRTLGQTSIPISAAIGAASPDIDIAFQEPIFCEPGLHLSVIMRVQAGAATASQVIQGIVDVRGCFE